VQILTQKTLRNSPAPATYSCVGRPKVLDLLAFAGTKVQILTPNVPCFKCLEDFGGAFPWGKQLKVLSLLALLVHKYKY
jgi:hypothetical protein